MTITIHTCAQNAMQRSLLMFMKLKKGCATLEIKLCYLWQLESAERLDHYLEAAARQQWRCGSGGQEDYEVNTQAMSKTDMKLSGWNLVF